MKVDGRRIETFLRDPGRIAAVLLHGEDEGLIRERAAALTRAVAGATDDPFRVVELPREAWSDIAAERAALALTGGRRAIRVREAADALLPALEAAVRGPGDGLVIIEAVGLGRGKLRNFAEAATEVAAIACYPETGAALLATVERQLAAEQVTIDRDALRLLGDLLGEDRAAVRGEAEKLALYVGAGGRLRAEDVRAVVGDGGGASAEDAVLAALAGNAARADRALERALAEGVAAIALLRIALQTLQRLHGAAARMAAGASMDEAMRAMRPPVFFKTEAAIRAVLGRWTSPALAAAIAAAREAELGCKQTGSRPEALARHYVAALAATRSGALDLTSGAPTRT